MKKTEHSIQKGLNRRDFLKDAAMTTLIGSSAWGRVSQEKRDWEDLARYDILLPRVQFRSDGRVPDQWNIWPIGDLNLLQELQQKVQCKVKIQPNIKRYLKYGETHHFNAVLDLDHGKRLCRFPLIFMTSEGAIAFSHQQRLNLKAYLEQGGFALMDDCCFGSTADYFFQCCVQLLKELFGADSVRPIPHQHEIFHNVHDLGERGLPHVSGQYHEAHGLFLEGRLAAFISSTDLHCGWTDRDHAWYGPQGRPPGNAAYEEAIEMGINVLMYAISH